MADARREAIRRDLLRGLREVGCPADIVSTLADVMAPAIVAGIDRAAAELLAERDAMRPVVEAARAWVRDARTGDPIDCWADKTDLALVTATEAFERQVTADA